MAATEHGGQGLHGHAHDVVLGLLGGQHAAGGLHMEAQHHRPRIAGMEAVTHDSRPQPARGAELGHLLEQVIVRVEEERQLRGEIVDGQAGGQRRLDVGDGVGQREGHFLRRCRARRDQFHLRPVQHVVIRRAKVVDVLHQSRLMKLRAPVQHRRHCRNPHARPDVPRQVDDPRAHVGFFFRHVRERRDVDGNEQKRQPKALQHARPHGVSVVQPQVPAGHHKQSRGRHDAPKRD